MPEASPDYYAILGVPHDASPEDIHAAFRHRAQECHPDLHPGDPEAVERFKSVNRAYHLLSNEQERRAYDAGLTQKEAGHTDFEATVTLGLKELFLGCRVRLMVPRATACSCCSGSGLVEMRSSGPCTACGGSGWGPEEIYLGVRSREPCGRCQGRGAWEGPAGVGPCLPCRGVGWFLVPAPTEVRLPAGLSAGQRLRVPGQGRPIFQGGQGDLFVRIEVQPGPWEREGADLIWDLPVPPRLLAKGGRVPLQTPLEHLWVTIPPRSRPGLKLPFPGRGFPRVGSERRGTLWVRLVPGDEGR